MLPNGITTKITINKVGPQFHNMYSNCFLVRFFFLFVAEMCLATPRNGDIYYLANEGNILLENHYVKTEDGYILNLHRFDQKPSNGTSPKVMFLMHGLLGSSPNYYLYPKKSAAFFFHNLGYDIWMGNARGNTFSRNHTVLDPDDQQFWNFSWHEIGYYDLPAMIDYVLKTTKQDQLIYIGHSQGVTSVFVMLSERPEYNKKIKLLHAMTPPLIMKNYHKYLPKRVKIENINGLEDWVNRLDFYEVLPYRNSKIIMNWLMELCRLPFMMEICKGAVGLAVGPISPHSFYEVIRFAILSNGISNSVDKSKYQDMLYDCVVQIPAGASFRQFLHYIQIALSGRFQKFDFGKEKNQKMYGSSQPPEYNWTNVRTKIHILYGTHDYLVLQSNIPTVLNKLRGSVVAVNKINLFNHLDFACGGEVLSIQKIISQVIKQFA